MCHATHVTGRGGPVNAEFTVLGTITLPGVGRSARYLRGFARDMIGADHPRLGDIGLCLTEKFANATVHTASGKGGLVTVSVCAARGVVRTEVTDDGAGGARPTLFVPPGEPFSEHGRGLLLLGALSDRWGYLEDGLRTTVWAEFAAFGG
ncbi:ATP-binding protein [Spirillospora sp. CA-294931]|uniref:ATP-binding protein n=1 Tax=Spirillospora sp. CA-294931 TaxID=3240042 RepID=UPI003D935436